LEVVLKRIKHEGYNIPRVRNECLNYVKGDYVFWVDSDVILPGDSLQVLLNLLDPMDNVKISCILYADRIEDLNKPREKNEANLSLGCTLVESIVHKRIGKFDERFYCTDDMWFARMSKKLGYSFKIADERRCLHLRKFSYWKHVKTRFLVVPQSIFLLMTEGLLERNFYFRYIFYGALLTSIALSIVLNWFFFSMTIILFFLGVYHYHSLTSFLYALPIGLAVTVGLVIAFMRPSNWRLRKKS